MSNYPKNRVIVSAIIERYLEGQRYVYLQTRWKLKSSPAYSGLLEIPAGGIRGYENLIFSLKREVKEETGLEVVKIIGGFIDGQTENIVGNRAFVFQPYLCQQMISSKGGLAWIGFVFRCEVQGTVDINRKEAKEPRWILFSDLKHMIEKRPEVFFPLQYPVLKHYVENMN